ncbi:FKBP-type peptidyl-prolyl cis-trans isomerase [Desulforhopalus vacuolatus]|uniref:FKBP-type peptidyl-prolyl cis-trans isomerase n=1 Tax=Desulforhopalus vacuolatus TaxID=40414 RepID=UPI0019654875|nr:FKBP-type peptidyl-prolyl cis-trans isomerase [Desulforhopalus vacuolatus]MBM9519844.1 FKBP-type peptidyl-prolyl cis-trans isomerase [Desulforhopalus vacuolatus]
MSTVTIAVNGLLDNGKVFFSVDRNTPLTFSLGNSDLPPTVEQALEEMKAGEVRKVKVTPVEGYGVRQKDLLQTIENKELIKRLNPAPGMMVSLRADKDGTEQSIPATVIEVNEDSFTVDYNHPLAGHNLTYELELLKKE